MDPDRFVLTSVEVRHFKSIQGSVQLRIPKKASLLAVVGPNGAGKTVCLEAIAFATGAQPQHLRCKSLTDLLSTNGQPEVQVVWSTFSGKQLVVSVVLKSTKDRVFKLNGKLSTRSAVRKELLHRNVFGELSFVRQAQVAELVQNGSPQNLAHVVAEVSGWNKFKDDEATAAGAVNWLNTQLTAIRHSIADMQNATANDTATAEAEAVRDAAQKIVDSTAQALRQRVVHVLRLVRLRISALEALQNDQDQRATRLQLAIADSGGSVQGVSSLQELMARLHGAETDLRGLQCKLQQQQAVLSELVKQEEQHGALCAERDDSLIVVQQLQKEFSCAQDAVEQERRVLREIEAWSAQAHDDAAVRGELERAQEAAAYLCTQLEVVRTAAAAGRDQVDQCKDSIESCAKEARVGTADARMRLCAATERVKSARSSIATAQRHAGDTKARLLARCSHVDAALALPLMAAFTFKPEACDSVRRFSAALSLLMKPLADVLLAPTMAAVTSVLRSGAAKAAHLRVWPLDSIQFSAQNARMQRALQAFPPGELVQPLSLCSFSSINRPAMWRMFGGILLAADDKVAEAVVQRFGIPCITIDGKRHSSGALEGGYRPPDATRFCQDKLDADASSAALAQADADVTAAEAQRQECEAQLQRATAHEVRLAALQEALERAERAHHGSTRLVKQLESQAASAQTRCRELANLVAARGDGEGGGAAEREGLAASAARLQARVDELSAAATSCERELQAAQRALEQASEACDAVDADALGALRRESEATLAALEGEVAERTAAVDKWRQASAEAQAASEATERLHAQLQDARDQLAATAASVLGLRKDEAHCTARLAELPDLAAHAPHQANADGAPVPASACDEADCTTIDAAKAACTQAHAAWQVACGDAEALPRCRLEPEQRRALLQRQARLTSARTRLAQLEAAARVLQQDVAAARAAALRLNGHVFARLAAAFTAALATALPEFEFRAEATDGGAAERVRVEFRKAGDAAGRWSEALVQLSGGQRSLVSLAYVLAATSAGVAPSLMLVDEVDAALDEANQARVGDMLRRCAAGGGCQVLAVSHSDAFHGWCDTFVKVAQDGGGGGTVAEVVGAPCAAAAAPVRASAAKSAKRKR